MTQVLSNEELDTAICFAKSKWNSEADHMNQWCDMGGEEHCELSGRAVESAVLAKLADKLMDAERLDWMGQYGPSHQLGKASQGWWCKPNAQPREHYDNLRAAIDAALASKVVKP